MSEWIEIGNLSDFPENEAIIVEDSNFGEVIVVVFQNDEYNVLSGVCSHEDFELGGSPIQDGQLTCLLHMSSFDLKNGKVLNQPAEDPLAVYTTKIDSGKLWVKQNT